MNWTKNLVFCTCISIHCSTRSIPENADSTLFLGLTLTEELLQFKVEKMNNYAQKVTSEKTMSRRSTFKNWKAANIIEMKAFLGLLRQMGVVNLPNLQDYWSRDPFLQSNSTWRQVIIKIASCYFHVFDTLKMKPTQNLDFKTYLHWSFTWATQYLKSSAPMKTFQATTYSCIM